jgi:hypothetical protein
MSEVLRVRGWSEFQHYKNRNPPWIKLHFALLSSKDWVMWDDASRVLAVACMLIASRNDGQVPADPDYLQRVAYLNKKPNFNPLIECGFLEGASTMLADCKHDASAPQANARPEERRGEERESRKRPSKRCPPDFQPDSEFALREIPDLDLTREVQKFRDYEFTKPRSDWPAVWRNWISNARDKGWYSKKANGYDPYKGAL